MRFRRRVRNTVREKGASAWNHCTGRHHKIGMNMLVKNPGIPNPSQVEFKSPLALSNLPLGPEILIMPRALFDQQRIGVTFKGTGHKKLLGQPIADRVLRQGIGNRRSTSEKSRSFTDDTGIFDEEEDAFPYRVAARSTLDSMMRDNSEKNREEIKQALARIHEPLQQYTVLFGALKEIDYRTDLSPDEKQSLKNAFSEMMTDLVNRDRSGIRKGLHEGAESSPVSAKMDAVRTGRGLSDGLRDIRFKIGARAKGGIDEELTAMVMAKTLIKNVGAPYVEEAMDSVCSRLMPTLRKLSAIKEAAYFLTRSDAAAFCIAKTGFKVAKDLKRDLVDKTGILCRLHHVEAAVILFTAIEQGWGKGKALQLVNQLVDLKNAAPFTRAKVYTVIRDATDMLPIMAWSLEKLSHRTDLLEDMDRQVSAAYAEIPLLTTKAERKEEEWRNVFAAGRAPTLVDRP